MEIFGQVMRLLTAPFRLAAALARDTAGNTLVIAAIAVIPMTAMAGSAIDMARIYTVKARLQQACDAGALAGRQFMTGTTLDPIAEKQATKFFNSNFQSGWFLTNNVTFQPTTTSDNQVVATATATVPMTIMGTALFNVKAVPLIVNCQARLEIPNLDVMFVLDTTGSMTTVNSGDTVTRLSALQTAVGNFYDTIDAAKTGTSQIRYGFVPYSDTVNVGMLLRREWMVDNWTYQSREQDVKTTTTTTSTGGATVTTYGAWQGNGNVQTFKTSGDPESCVAPANTAVTTTTYTAYVTNSDGSKTRTATQTINGSTYTAALVSGACVITETRYNKYVQSRTETVSPNPNAGQVTTTKTDIYWWNYKPVDYNVSTLKGSLSTGVMAGGTFKATIDGGGNNTAWKDRNVTWNAANACIEERETVRTSDYSTIPSDAKDLDVDTPPVAGKPATQWRPFLPSLVYARGVTSYSNPGVATAGWSSTAAPVPHVTTNYINLINYLNPYAACPSPSRKLAVMTKSQVTTYMNSLAPSGHTYHDIGMIWGLRLISPDGLFASENTTTPNGSPINRNIIFMTDGDTETNYADYDAYGLAALDRRRTDESRLPKSSPVEQDNIVENRLTALCQVAQKKNITVWVIAFGTTLTPLLSGCSTPGGHAFEAKNAKELNDAFAKIAAQIAQLRLAQ